VACIAVRANLEVVDGRILHAESEPYARSVKTSVGVLHISHTSVVLSGPQEQLEGAKFTSEVSWKQCRVGLFPNVPGLTPIPGNVVCLRVYPQQSISCVSRHIVREDYGLRVNIIIDTKRNNLPISGKGTLHHRARAEHCIGCRVTDDCIPASLPVK
jgi:hypothetical protein